MKFRLVRIVVPVLLFTVLLVHDLPAAAQSNGLGITPKLSYTVNAGEQRSDTLYVNNLSTSQVLNLKLKVIDFKPQDETGAPKLLQASDEPLTPWSLKPYMTLPDRVTIEPGKSKLIPFTIKIPKSVGAGSYYSAVQYTAVSDFDQEKVNVAASSASLIFVTVPGDASELLNLVQFGPYEGGKFQTMFASKPPASFAYRIKNSGNISESPSGSIVVKNFFGHVVRSIDNANPLGQLVIIGQTRRFEVCAPKSDKQEDLGKPSNCKPLKLMPGRYTAQIELLYGQNGKTNRQIGATSTFWYLPIWFVILALIVLTAIVYGGWRLYKKLVAPRHRRTKR